jgi:hypothetical protein
VTTDPNSGGYSALIPVVPVEQYDGPAMFRCEIDLQEGTRREQIRPTQLDIFVPNIRDVAGILIRNSAITAPHVARERRSSGCRARNA